MHIPSRFRSWRLVWAALAAVVLSWGATSRAAGPLTITRWSVDSGGSGFTHVGLYTLAGTAGQSDAARLQGLGYLVNGGFWGPGPLVVAGVAIPDPTEPADPGGSPAPLVARILPAAPNPTSNAARLGFEVPEPRRVRIQVFSVAGALVRTVTDQVWPAGRHEVGWDGRSAGGDAAAAGLYFVRVRLGSLERTQKLLLVR